MKCKISKNENNILISGIREDAILLDIEKDVDFTELVNELVKVIDPDSSIEYEIEGDNFDDKTSVVLETIKGIFDKFNSVE